MRSIRATPPLSKPTSTPPSTPLSTVLLSSQDNSLNMTRMGMRSTGPLTAPQAHVSLMDQSPLILASGMHTAQFVSLSPLSALSHLNPLPSPHLPSLDPLLSLVNVPVLGQTLQGWVNAYKEGEWLPKWASPGYRGSMVGTMGDVSLADAIVKGIPGFDTKVAYEAIYKDAFEIPQPNSGGTGRECFQSYLKLGYIPHGTCTEVVSRTLDYYQSDFAIARAAEKMNDLETAQILSQRMANYSSIFDFETGFMRSISEGTGKFTEPFDPYAWGGDYTEAGPWQYRFSIPFDVPGLAKLYEEAGYDMCDVLTDAQVLPSVYHLGGYGGQIHEMTEMSVNCWGQYSHNNQPSHHILYMFGSIKPEQGVTSACASTGQYYLRKALTELYSPTDEMFAGDEDNGEMGAWYILTSLGLYSLSPGTEEYVLGSPLFQSVTISLEGNGIETKFSESLVVQAHDNSAENVYVQGVKWNGTPIGISSIKYSELMRGGVLEFQMGPQPPSHKN
jgi:predicted alpha-1,2-mannosidase